MNFLETVGLAAIVAASAYWLRTEQRKDRDQIMARINEQEQALDTAVGGLTAATTALTSAIPLVVSAASSLKETAAALTEKLAEVEGVDLSDEQAAIEQATADLTTATQTLSEAFPGATTPVEPNPGDGGSTEPGGPVDGGSGGAGEVIEEQELESNDDLGGPPPGVR